MRDPDAATTAAAIWDAADRPDTRNRAFQSAFRRGIRDRLAGVSRRRNPYPDHGTFYHNGVTFSRAFRRYWTDGWKAADQYLQRESRDASALR
jgi:hypothetical protein